MNSSHFNINPKSKGKNTFGFDFDKTIAYARSNHTLFYREPAKGCAFGIFGSTLLTSRSFTKHSLSPEPFLAYEQ